MKKIFSIILIFLCMNTDAQTGILLQRIQEIFSAQKGFFAVAAKDLQTGKVLLWNADTVFHAASTMKTPVMIEVFRQAEAGRFSMDDALLLKNTFSSIVDGSPFVLNPADDSEQELYKRTGQPEKISRLVYEMIINSSNLATNLIIEKVSAPAVMQTLESAGIYHIKVLRGVEDGKAFALGLNNSVTAGDLLILFEKMAEGTWVSTRACTEMIRILRDQRHNTMIPAALPAGAVVAHKTGSITGVQHDSGIVFLPDGRKFVLVMLSKQLENARLGAESIAKAARIVYDAVAEGSF
jgi:beta-lactamase class A